MMWTLLADTATTLPPNADQVTQSLMSGQAQVAAAMVASAGLLGLGLVILQLYLHRAVEAS